MGRKSLINKYRGISHNEITGKYEASISINRKYIPLGRYDTEMEGAVAYDNAVKENGLNRRLNFPDTEPENLIPNSRLIRLTQNKFAIVDEDDFEWLNGMCEWSAHLHQGKWWYAYGHSYSNGIDTTLRMHRVIMGESDLYIDHINNNGLDNRRRNLRFCTNRQNMMNRVPNKNCKSKYKGVGIKSDGRIVARISTVNKRLWLGTFNTEEEAAVAYNNAAIEHYGEFALLNIFD